MKNTVKRPMRFQASTFVFLIALACAISGMGVFSSTAFAAESTLAGGTDFSAPALEDTAPTLGAALADDTPLFGSGENIDLKPGDVYDVGKSLSSLKVVNIREGGTYTLKGKSMATSVHIRCGGVTVYLENGLDINPSVLAIGLSPCPAITIEADDGDIHLVSRKNATVKLGGYLSNPSINKIGKNSTLYFETEDPANPGHIICDRSSYYSTMRNGSACAIGTIDPNCEPVSNIIFRSGKVTAKGAEDAAGIGSSGNFTTAVSVNNIVFEGTAEVTAIAGSGGAPGIGSVNGSTTGIVIKDNAKVTATGSKGAPGIGSGSYERPCDSATVSVSIEGGTVTAQGGSGAPGIGIPGGTVNAIKISGGTVTAKSGGSGSPGIGTGNQSTKNANIQISGGLVTVPGVKTDNPAIGTTSNSGTAKVKISGGTVDVKPGVIGVPKKDNETAYGISEVTIDGGTVRTQSFATYPSPINSSGARVYPATIALEKKSAGLMTSFTVKALSYHYGDKDLQLRDGYLYIWLPNGGAAESAIGDDGTCYVGSVIVNGSSTQGTLYIGPNVILDGGDDALTDGEAKISLSATRLTDVNPPTRNGYTVFGYRSPDKFIPVVDGTTLQTVPGDKRYVNEDNWQWIYSGPYPATLSTRWKPISYGIEFDSNVPDTASTEVQGTMPKKNNLTFGEDFTLPKNQFVLNGYKFTGWNTEPDGSGYGSFEDEDIITGEDIVVGSGGGPYKLYAQWEPLEYDVTFESGTKVTGEPYTQTLTFDQEEALDSVKFESTEYRFAGWTLESPSGETTATYADGATVENLCTFESDGTPDGCTLKAQWVANDTVSIVITNNDDPVEILKPEENIELVPIGTTSGGTITGFEEETDGIYVCDNVPSGTYGIDFDPEAAEYNTPNITINHEYGTHTSVSLVYYTATVNNVESDHVTAFFGHPTSSGDSTVPVLKGTPVTLWAEPIEGYVFDGYTCSGVEPGNLDKSKGDTQTVTINGKVEITPHARPVNYTVIFDANVPTGASSAVHGEMDSLSMAYNEAQQLPKNAFRLNGYTFAGWNTEANGRGNSHADGASLENLTTVDGGTVTLYAQWEPNTYSVHFDGNTPTNASTSISGYMSDMTDLVYDGNDNKLSANAFTLPGYEFAGWNTSADGTGTFYADEESVRNLTTESGATVVLYAQWDPLAYTITFNADGGSGTMDSFKATFDASVQLPPCEFTYDGHVFSHWSTLAPGSHYANGASVKNLCGTPNESGKLSSVELTANWAAEGETAVIVRLDGAPVTNLGNENVTLKSLNGNTVFSSSSQNEGRFVFTDLPEGSPEDDYYVVAIDGYDTDETVIKRGETIVLDYYSVSIKGGENVSSAWIGNEGVQEIPHVLTGTVIRIGTGADTGYVFDGYTADGIEPTWSPETADQSIIVNGTVEITAHARGAAYAVHFDSNVPSEASTASQFSGSMTDQEMVYGNGTSNLSTCTFALPGYTFDGWNTKADRTGGSYENGASVENLTTVDGGTVTLYAKWKPCTYSITYNAGKGSGTSASLSATFDETFSLPSPSNSNLNFTPPSNNDKFIGWTARSLGHYYLAEDRVVNFCTFDANGTLQGWELTAQWADSRATTIIITDDNKPSERFTAEDITLRKEEDSTTYENPIMTSSGVFTFSSSTPSSSGTTSGTLPDGTYSILVNNDDTEIDVAKGNVAKVAYCTVEITGDEHASTRLFDLSNEETISDPTFVLVDSQIGIDTTVDPGYYFESYTAIGTQPTWGSDGATLAKQTVTINGEVFIEAHAENAVYSVHFDPNGGTGTMDEQDMVYDQPQNLFANAFTRAGYIFAGWNTKADGTGTSYSDKENVRNLTTVDEGEVVLYAQWSLIPPPAPPTSIVDRETAGHGTTLVDPENAAIGKTVTITPQPDEGYGLFSIEAIDDAGAQISLVNNEDGTYSFEMPAGNVVVKTTYKVILPFPDLDWNHWGYDDIALAYERGLLVGYDSGLFGPDDVTTRAMAATVLWRFAGCPHVDGTMPFSDVEDGLWYTEAIRWAASEGIAKGYEGTGLFGPEDTLTREQVVVLLMRYAKSENMDTSARDDLSSFPDGSTASAWAQDSVEWAVAEGLLRGDDVTGMLDPLGGGTRAALATLVMRYDTMLPIKPGDSAL